MSHKRLIHRQVLEATWLKFIKSDPITTRFPGTVILFFNLFFLYPNLTAIKDGKCL